MKNQIMDKFLEGKRCVLRPLAGEDINKRYLKWLNDREVTEYMETGVFPTTLDELRDFYNRVSTSKTDIMFAVLDKRKNLHIGNIKLGSINWVHRFADLGIMIGDKRYWGKGYGPEACRLVLEYAFDRLNLNKVVLGVCSTHKNAINVYKKVGFRIEGRIKRLLNLKRRYVDKLMMGIDQAEFARIIK